MSPTTMARLRVIDSPVQPAPERRRWPYLAIIAALALAVILLLLRPWAGNDAAGPPPPQVPATAAPSAAPSPAQGGGTGPDLTYVGFHGVQLPVSRAHGPFRSTGELVSGFTHDREGAALAAAHYGTRISAPLGPGVYEPTIHRYGLGGSPGVLDALHAQYEQARADAPGVRDGQPIPSQQNARALGYRVPAYRPNGPITVHLLMSGDGPAGAVLVDLPVTVEWVDGTWKVQVPPDGNFPGGQAQSTAGFTLF